MKKRVLLDYLFMVLGAACMACGIVIFLAQNNIAAGGPPGIAITVNHLTGMSPGLAIALINAPLILLGYKQFGRSFLLRSIINILLASAFTDLFYHFYAEVSVSDDRMLNALFGGGLIGAGIGLMFKGGGASGGWSILARLIANHMHIGIGRVIIALDCLVVISSALVFRDIETALFGVIGIFVCGRMVDLILTGKANAKAVHISCRDANKLIPLIDAKLCTPGAIIHCHRLDGQESRDLILITVSREQIPILSNIIKEHESSAYMIVLDATEFHASETAMPSKAA